MTDKEMKHFQDDLLANCPFCGAKPKRMMSFLGEECLFEHPDNDCMLAAYVFHENFITKWNQRVEIKDESAT